MRADRLPAGRDWTLFALPPDAYENYERNMAEIRRWIREAVSQLDYYTEIDK